MVNNSLPLPDENLNAGIGDYHIPVMLEECIEALNIQPSGIYVDCTFGGGGHSRAILQKLNADGMLIAFDQDSEANKNLPVDSRVLFIPQNFRHLKRFLRLEKISQVDGILADLGVSSHQFDVAARGFSTRLNGPLDMRMNTRINKTAADILQNYSEEALHRIFERYGEVTNAKSLARHIVSVRKSLRFNEIDSFKQTLQSLVKGNPNKYFAQVFQALRIEVNEELDALKEMLNQIPDVLKPGGRVAIITFHSLEDRMVKNFFKGGGVEEQEKDLFGRSAPPVFKMISKKPILASAGELKMNSRSRSAKLRVAEKN